MNDDKEVVLSKIPDAVLKQRDDGFFAVVSMSLDAVISIGVYKTEAEAWEAACKFYADGLVTLPCGVQIRDSRGLGNLGLNVLSSGVRRYCSLGVTKSRDDEFDFYISVKGVWLDSCDIDEFVADLQFIRQAAIEASQHFNGGEL